MILAWFKRPRAHRYCLQFLSPSSYCFHLTAICPGEPSQPVSLWFSSSTCSGKEPLMIRGMGFYGLHVLPVTQPSVSKHWREHETLNRAVYGLPLSFLIHNCTPDGNGIASFMSAVHCQYQNLQYLSQLILTSIQCLHSKYVHTMCIEVYLETAYC